MSGALVLEKVVKEGWLEKKSRLLGAWRKRWFVLDGSTLYSFKQERVGLVVVSW
jgi:hypothetical protein